MECIDLIRSEFKDATPDELNEVLELINKRFAKIMADGETPAAQAVKQAAEEVADEVKLAALIEKRNSVINKAARQRGMDFINTSFADKPFDGLEAMIGGVSYARAGARDSVIANQRALQKKYISRLEKDLTEAGVWELFASNTADLDVSRALWDFDEPAFKTYSEEVQAIAKAIHNVQEMARADANQSGAWIGKMKGYIVRQSHDAVQMAKAGSDAWVAAIKPLLDLDKMFPSGAPDNLDEWLAKTYSNLVTGIRDTPDLTASKMAGFVGPGNLAKKASAERVLHFKNADSWFQYNQQFGTRFLSDAVVGGLMKSADSTGLMMKFGTNPEYNLKAMVDAVSAKASQLDPKRRAEIGSKSKRIEMLYDGVSGKMNSPINAVKARRHSNVRAWLRITSLGGAVISSITDPFLRASELKYQGKSFLSETAQGFADLLKGRSEPEKRAILHELEEYSEALIGSVAQRADPDDPVGSTLSKMERWFFKFNMQTVWSDRTRAGVAMAMSRNFAEAHAKNWADIGPDLQRVFSLYGIGEGEWAKIRKAQLAEYEGRNYLTAEAIDAVDQKLGMKWRSMVADRVDIAYLNPDSKTRAIMLQGLKPGSIPGDAIRYFMQFKTFPAAMIQKVFARELFGYGAESLGQSARRLADIRSREFQGMATLMLSMTAAGYIAMTAKDLLKGRNPRSLEDKRTWIAASLQGGALGIYGDFLFGETARNGAGFYESMAGPFVGKTSEAFNFAKETFGKGVEGELKSDAAAKALRLAVNTTPFNNVFWIRPAFDYAIMYRVQEALSPGYTRRMEGRIKKEHGQTFWLKPSEAAQ